MKKQFRKVYSFIVLTVVTIIIGCGQMEKADLLIINGNIYSHQAPHLQKLSIAVKGERILAIGSPEKLNRYKGRFSQVLDVKGALVLPGLTDAHAHIIGLGKTLNELNLSNTTSAGEIANLVRGGLASATPGEWISGRGWDQNKWADTHFPAWQDLQGTESHPVYLRRVDGHAAWINRTALEMAGITRETVDPPGGRIIRDKNGDPTGVLLDNAIDLVSKVIPPTSFETRLSWAQAAIRECNRYGLTGVHDAGLDTNSIPVFQELAARGELSLRLYGMLDGSDSLLLERFFHDGRLGKAGDRLVIRAVKLYSDGALGSRGAALLEDYSDDPGNRGLLTTSEDEIYRIAVNAGRAGFQVCTHAIGDLANRLTLNAYQRALQTVPTTDHRWRIEHAQVVSPEDLPRFSPLGVIPSMQPTHATSDMPWAQRRLGPERIEGAYAWRTLLDLGNRLPCGSDFPVESPDPRLGLYAAVTRQDTNGNPAKGWYPDQRMTLEEAIRGFTLDAAYAAFAEEELGSIEPGKLADFTIFDRELIEDKPESILNAIVLYTIVGGEIVYSAIK